MTVVQSERRKSRGAVKAGVPINRKERKREVSLWLRQHSPGGVSGSEPPPFDFVADLANQPLAVQATLFVCIFFAVIALVREVLRWQTTAKYRQILKDFYTAHNPEKLKDIETILFAYQGREAAMMEKERAFNEVQAKKEGLLAQGESLVRSMEAQLTAEALGAMGPCAAEEGRALRAASLSAGRCHDCMIATHAGLIACARAGCLARSCRSRRPSRRPMKGRPRGAPNFP